MMEKSVSKKIKVLLTNDDGCFAASLPPVIERLSDWAEVFVVVPDRERSAVGHSLTLNHPIRVKKLRKNFWITDGFPSDCVKAGVLGIMRFLPDLVISGINDGANLGGDINYSGTVSAAREGAMMGIRSFAVSAMNAEMPGYEYASGVLLKIAKFIRSTALYPETFLNVNIPALPPDKIKGVAVTSLGRKKYKEKLIKRKDPRGREYFWISRDRELSSAGGNTDHRAVERGRISVTPVCLDMTAVKYLEVMKKLNIRGRMLK